MEKLVFIELEKQLDDLRTDVFEFVGSCSRELNSKEFYLDSYIFSPSNMTKESYELWENTLPKFNVIREHYSIKCYCDTSGYDYWKEQKGRENYTSINIYVNSETNHNDIKNILNDLKEIEIKLENLEEDIIYIKD